ncbi:FKBP-type peptidyl-prolyl cis-trans isomerase [Rhodohalobacter mucosus]|uniref:FKBP-type peptidyl-prolyl cis-trans isomerase n=1 Tax=Rhodohalobacter mucosus TaxID=2079485 RepID=UPI0013049C6A|nr:FKBP-type peptidyl-prolyl cis-trans isomerase [Rhodohalobacter mucosus]
MRLIPALLVIFILSSCDTTDPFSFEPPDFSTVPPAFDYTEVDPVTVEPGIDVHVLEEGTGTFSVTQRDQISFLVTLRSLDGDIIYSSFSNGNALPITNQRVDQIRLSNGIINPRSPILLYTSGLRKGLTGMKVGEIRTIIVSPEQGYADVTAGLTAEYSESTLQYDIELTNIVN